MKRILINSDDSSEEAIKLAFVTAALEATKNESRTIILLVPVLKQWESTAPARFLGQDVAKGLLRNGFVELTPTIRLEIHSIGTLRKRASAEELLAIHVLPEIIEAAIAQTWTYKTCVYLPWTEKDASTWKKIPPDEIKEVPPLLG